MPLCTRSKIFETLGCKARLAQSVERKALNLVVVGSSPTVGVLPVSCGMALVLMSGRFPLVFLPPISISFGGIPFFVVSLSVARVIVCPPNLNHCRLPVMARFSTFENLLCLVELLLRWHRSLLQSTTAKWTHWDLNPGPSACEADVIPLHHVPHAPSHSKGVCHIPRPATFPRERLEWN